MQQRRTNMLKVIRFTASWCQPCKILKPTIEELEKENKDVEFITVALDDEQGMSLATDYGVSSVPTLIFERDGLPFERTTGFVTKTTIQGIINSLK
jgi:thioredoxin 1